VVASSAVQSPTDVPNPLLGNELVEGRSLERRLGEPCYHMFGFMVAQRVDDDLQGRGELRERFDLREAG
jgi:hypothetical protein